MENKNNFLIEILENSQEENTLPPWLKEALRLIADNQELLIIDKIDESFVEFIYPH